MRVRKNSFLNMRDLSTFKYRQKGSWVTLHLFNAYGEPATIMSVFYGLTLSISKTSTLDGNLYYLHFADGDTRHREAGCHPQGNNAR